MLRLALTCLLIFLLGSIQAEPPNIQRGSEILEEYFERKCTRNADDIAFLRLINTHSLIVLRSRREPITEEEVYNVVCNPTVGYEHLDSLMIALEYCFDTEEKYLPDFARTTYDSKEDLCKGDKNDFIAMVDDLKNNQCVNLKRNLTMVGDNCLLDMIKTNLDFNSDTTLTKDLVCGQLKTVRDCLIDGVKRVCTDDVFSNFLMRIFKPYLDWCEKH